MSGEGSGAPASSLPSALSRPAPSSLSRAPVVLAPHDCVRCRLALLLPSIRPRRAPPVRAYRLARHQRPRFLSFPGRVALSLTSH